MKYLKNIFLQQYQAIFVPSSSPQQTLLSGKLT